jgi:hypothetical protein
MVVLTLLLWTALTGAPRAAAPTVKDAAWIAGCWDLTRNGRHIVESWTAAEGGTIMAVSRTVANGRTSEWEFLIIREGAAALEYVAKPSRQPEATFTSTTVSPTELVFENPAHDFPKKISYKRDGDTLLASIEGPMNGQTRRIDFPYKKAACGS